MDLRRRLAVRAARRRIRGVPDPFISGLASALKARTNADAAFVSFVTAEKSYVVGEDGLPPKFITGEGVDVQSSFCAHLVASRSDGLVINNTREFAMLDLCPTTREYGAWVGAPVRFRGQVIGAAGVADHEPRRWPEDTLQAVRQTGAAVEKELGD